MLELWLEICCFFRHLLLDKKIPHCVCQQGRQGSRFFFNKISSPIASSHSLICIMTVKWQSILACKVACGKQGRQSVRLLCYLRVILC